MTEPTPKTILATLWRMDPIYGENHPKRFNQIKEVAAQLPTILADYLDKPLTPQDYFKARILVCREVLSKTTYQSESVFDTLAALKEWAAYPSRAFRFAGTDEATYLLSDQVDLIESLKQRLQNGSLTFRDTLSEQPGVFLP